MSKYLDSKLDMYTQIDNQLTEEATVVNSFTPLKNKHQTFSVRLKDLLKKRNERNQDTSGLSKEKKKTKDDLAEETARLAKLATVWAKDNGKPELLPTLDVEKTDIINASAANAQEIATKVEKVLRDNKDDMPDAGIDMPEIDGLKAMIGALDTSSVQPRKQQGKNKVANNEYKAEFKPMDELVEDLENLIVGKFLKTNRTFVNTFLANKRIFDPASRQTKLTITVTDAEGKPLEGVYCDLLQVADEEQYTDVLGKATILGLKSGTYTLKLSKDGLPDHSQTVEIKRGQNTKVVVKMG